MRLSHRVASLLAVALILELGGTASGSPTRQADPTEDGPIIVHASCPTGEGLGVASHPGPAVAVARRFLLAQRARSSLSMSATADRWFRYRVAPRSPAGFRAIYPRVGSHSDAWRFRTRPPRWLDTHFGPIGPFLNARLKLLAAGVPVYSCPHSLIRRLVRAMWWIQVILPGCDCDPDRVLDLLVVRRSGRYRVFGLA